MKRRMFLSKMLSLAMIVLTACWFHQVVRAQAPGSNADSVATERQAKLEVQLGHSDAVLSAAISADGKYVLTGSRDRTARLWDAATGKEVRQFTGHSEQVNSVAISPDGKYVLTGSSDGTARLWETASGKQVRRFGERLYSVLSVVFSADGKYMLIGSSDGTARLWETASGKQARLFAGHSDRVNAAVISADGQYVVTGSEDKTARLWEVETGKQVRLFEEPFGQVKSVAISTNGKYIVTACSDRTVRLWETETGKEVRQFKGHAGWVNSVAISADGKYVLTGSHDGTERLWETETGKEVRRFVDQTVIVQSVAMSADGKYVLTCSWDKTALWETETGKEVRQFAGHSSGVKSAAISPDGKYVLTSSGDFIARLWETESGRQVRQSRQEIWAKVVYFSDHCERARAAINSQYKSAKFWEIETGKELRLFGDYSIFSEAVAFSADGKYVLASCGWYGNKDYTARLSEIESGKEVRQFVGHSNMITSTAISVDGKYVLTGSWDDTARLWEVGSGKEIRRFVGHSDRLCSVAFSPDGKHIATSSDDGTIRLWETETGKEVRQFAGHLGLSNSVAFSPDGKYVLTGSDDSTTRFWEMATGKEICRLVSFKDGTWAVVDPDGRYDASNNGEVEGMHWVVGSEPITLSQLKHRYYEPGLLAKVLKGEPLRDVTAFKDVKLFPDVAYQTPAPGSTQLKIKLTNRGGGIGRVTVLVNGKEVTADARGPRPNPQAKEAELTVDLSGAAIKPGQENDIRVLAYNADGWLSSRGPVSKWKAPGEVTKDPPELYAIVGGISTYSDKSVSLRYAAKDAEDMAKALTVGAKNLFGVTKTHITVLSSSGNTGTVQPTKENFRKAFETARKARPGDVLVVYLAGHGIAQRLSADSETYCYLTAEWRGGSLSDEAIRNEQSITSDDLAEWIKRIPALKQIMMLDTCAAGAAAEKLKLLDKRLPSSDQTSDQIRALDRLKDRTGFHVLMGAAADKISYEASQYNQGLLTYALLEGMKYGAVKNETVEVSALFQYARDRVPALARSIGIGGVQQPQIMAPKADSFPVARFTGKDSEAIYLAEAKPLVLRPRIRSNQDEDLELEVALEKAVRQALRDESEPVTRGAAGREPRLVYLDDGELANAVLPGGRFTVEGEQIKIRMKLKRGEQEVPFEVAGLKSDIPLLAAEIVKQIAEAMKAFR